MKELLDLFNEASGLNAHHVAISYPDLSIEFDGYDEAGRLFHIGSGPTDGDLGRHAARLGIFQRHRLMEKLEHDINYGQRAMSEGSTIRDKIAQAKMRKARAVEGIHTALANHSTAVGAIESAAKQYEDEAVDLQQSVADLTNGGPA